MINNPLKKALAENKVTLGSWIQIGHAVCGEIFAHAGFQWVCADMEHGGIDIECMSNIFRAIENCGAVPVARVPVNDLIWIRRSLDAGARGLIIPMVKTVEEAQAAVDSAKYAPLGERGFGYCRANQHGMEFDAYAASANDEIPIIAQIEHKDAIANLEDIVQVPGIDGCFIGPYDLSGSMGIPGRFDDLRMIEALNHYREVCKKHHIPAGTHIVLPTETNIQQALDEGYTLIALGCDTSFLWERARHWLNTANSQMV